jgi:hypothetical protein
VSKQRMNKQELPKPSLQGNVRGITVMEDHYYVQRLTEQIFLVRERISAEGAPGPDDRIVRSFGISHDAYMYANNANTRQRELDEQYGHWKQNAV